ncbi:hypothetical protein FIBSPDRAFT_958356 [Athelia psychrophila]|uniref:Uncharacterized protein n=1 Tax=Athelia psychrophila TaxID=1759441 RepID=A0A166EQV7_9AGAM|nr:hypothetical protein FIBSPDRAFT_958356 [Fibularhizoctonia sp. CBS 109695]
MLDWSSLGNVACCMSDREMDRDVDRRRQKPNEEQETDFDRLRQVTGSIVAMWRNRLSHLSFLATILYRLTLLTMPKHSEAINIAIGNPKPANHSSQRIILSKDILRKSNLKVKYNLYWPYINPQLEENEHRLSKSVARRAVALARATRLAIKARERSLSARIAEVEQYVGLLRQKRAVVRNQGREADEQMGVALDKLHQHGLAEQALSDCEPDDEDCEDNFLNSRFQPPSSDHIYTDNAISDTSSCGSNSGSHISSPITSIHPDGSVKKSHSA